MFLSKVTAYEYIINNRKNNMVCVAYKQGLIVKKSKEKSNFNSLIK